MRRKFSYRVVILAVAVLLAGLAGDLRAEADKAAPAGKATKVKATKAKADKVKANPVAKVAAKATKAKPVIAHIRMAGPVLASPPDFSLFANDKFMTMKDWLERLAKARCDNSIAVVALEIDSLQIGLSQAVELADAIRRLNKVKPVHTHLVSGSLGQYIVAAAGKTVSMEPAGALEIIGIGAELMFFRGTLDWLGVEPQFIQIGKYKGASEPMMNTAPSPELKQQYNSLLDSLYEIICRQMAGPRGLTVKAVKAMIDEGPLTANEALKGKLVDKLITRQEWLDKVGREVPAKAKEARMVNNYASKTSPTVNLSNPFAMLSMMLKGGAGGEIKSPTIAIIHADGVIYSGKSGTNIFGGKYVGSRTLVKCFDKARTNSNIKAVVFRINSPGGSAIASELIYQAAKRCAAVKPVIVSISGMGASGGYYIACGGNTIFADESAVIGSIGVVSGKIALTGLLKKLHVSTYEITRGKNAGLYLTRPWNKSEKAALKKHALRIYDIFVSRVKTARKDKVKDISKVAQGRIFTARQCISNGLVDSIGGLSLAVKAAKKSAGIKASPHYIILPRPKTLADVISGDVEASLPGPVEKLLRRQLGWPASMFSRTGKLAGVAYLAGLAEQLETENTLTAMPHYLQIR